MYREIGTILVFFLLCSVYHCNFATAAMASKKLVRQKALMKQVDDAFNEFVRGSGPKALEQYHRALDDVVRRASPEDIERIRKNYSIHAKSGKLDRAALDNLQRRFDQPKQKNSVQSACGILQQHCTPAGIKKAKTLPPHERERSRVMRFIDGVEEIGELTDRVDAMRAMHERLPVLKTGL